MNETQRIFMAALSGLTNMGMALPEKRDLRDVRQAISDGKYTLGDAVDQFAARYCEGEEHQRIFREEAQSWYDRDMKWTDLLPKMQRAWRDSFPARWQVALNIDEGAVNPIPIATAIADACREVNDERGGNSHHDAAVRIMVHQLAHITGIGTTVGLGEYIKLKDTCRFEADAVARLRDINKETETA